MGAEREMGSEEDGHRNIHPSFAALIRKVSENIDGIRVEDLHRDDVLVVRTAHNVYIVKVLDPKERRVMVSGPEEYLPEPKELCLQGSCLTEDSSLFGGWIIVGMRLHFTAFRYSLLPSSTQKVYLNGVLLLGDK